MGRPAAAARPGGGLRVPRLERRRPGGDAGRDLPADAALGPALLHDRPRGVLRLPGGPAAGLAHRQHHAPDRVAGERLLHRPAAEHRPRPRGAARDRAAEPLEDVLGRRARGRPDDPGLAGDHPRRPARRHAPLPAGAGHRHRGARRGPGARPVAVALRGPDGHRRRAARLAADGRGLLGEPVGRGAALRLDRPEPEGRAGPRRAVRDDGRDALRHLGAHPGRGGLRARGRAGRRGRRRGRLLRARARAAGRRARLDPRGHPVGRDAGRRVRAVPGRAGGGRRTTARSAGRPSRSGGRGRCRPASGRSGRRCPRSAARGAGTRGTRPA